MPTARHPLALLIVAFALAYFPARTAVAAEPKSTERTRQKQQAEQERAELRRKLDDLKADIVKTEKAHGHAADALASSEKAISNANRTLRELAAEQQRTQQKLQTLSQDLRQLEAAVAQQRKRLEHMLREQYRAGQEDRVRLLLSGDNPNRIAREMRYLSYVSAEQVKAIEKLQQDIATVEANKADAEEARAALEDIAAEQREQKALLEKEKGKRKVLATQLSDKLSAQRKQAGNLARDESRLSALVDRLAVVIAQQRKAEEEEARRRARNKAEAAAREKALADKARTENKGRSTAANKPPEPAKTPERTQQAVPEPPPPPDGNAFAALRGKGKLPVKGELAATFGAKRPDGPSWKGIFIKAGEGSDVHAAGAGEVIFADWMRGFGNLIIVDHGGQYLSIYGNNQSLLKRPGDRVKAGDVIATVGNSGGNEHSGLYFELRHQGRAIDPLAWLNR
ncbi:MAG: murein hydrolase activator EnvC family protein [Burkholderiaceae bacterium]|jgi:septal ring factor EnvC (AmiA/AmiB activator)